jgi:hypothetical protein
MASLSFILISMKKFFLFRRKEVSKASTFASDTGEGVDIFGVAADLLAFMTAEQGAVKMVFNNATPYEDNNLVDGDSMQKSSVTVSCEEGKEMDVIESIMVFIGRDGKTNIMKFDAVSNFSNLSDLRLGDVSDVVSQVRKSPVERATGKKSTKTFIGGTAATAFGTPNTIQGIDFESSENKPIVDFNESGITVSAGVSINGWTNSGTGGSTYNASVNGTPTKLTTVGREGSGVATVAADVTTTQYFILANQLEVGDDFTMYMVLSNTPSDILTLNNGRIAKGNVFGGDDATSFGLGGSESDASENLFAIRFDTFTGDPAKAPGNPPQSVTDENDVETMQVLVVRRTKDDVIFIHDASGQIISTFEKETGESVVRTIQTRYGAVVQQPSDQDSSSRSLNESGRLDGVLAIKNFGGAPNAPSPKFTGHIARFGVIQKDIGTENAASLAQDLHDLYKPIS